MAEPITNIKRVQFTKDKIKQKNIDEVLDAVSENKESVIKTINLATTLDENGTLDFLSALIKHKEDGLTNIMKEINKEQYANTLENASDLFFLLGDLNLKNIKHFTGKINEGMEEAAATDEEKKISYTGMLKSLKEPEINRSITMLLTFMRGMGKNN